MRAFGCLAPRFCTPRLFTRPLPHPPGKGANAKIEQAQANPDAGNQPKPLKGSPRLGFGVNASREPPGSSSARQGHRIQKLSRHKRTPMPGILRRLSRLVPLLRNGANRRVRHSERAPTQKQHLITGAVFVLVTRNGRHISKYCLQSRQSAAACLPAWRCLSCGSCGVQTISAPW